MTRSLQTYKAYGKNIMDMTKDLFRNWVNLFGESATDLTSTAFTTASIVYSTFPILPNDLCKRRTISTCTWDSGAGACAGGSKTM